MAVDSLLWLIPALPLFGFVINGVWGHRLGNPLVAAVAIAGPLAAFVLSVLALLSVHEGLGPTQVLYEWIGTGDLSVPFGLQVDALTAIMLMNVTGIGTAIHLYSYGYMREDPSFARFMAYLNLFLCAMLLLVMGDNLLLLFVGWEGVGLCSYLLIGFWYTDFANVDAGRKAFIVNRIGDFSFLVGMFILYSLAGTLEWHGLELAIGQLDLAAPVPGGPLAGWTTASALTLAGLCLFGGATGKSAQIPLYVWLPDAMAGPTPVSALIHAATMVTAGVYLLGRLDFLFILLPDVATVVAVIAACTALLSGLIALAQYDIKKVLAYSTVSQLGFMFAGMATTFWSGGLFHVVTHAFFKALLFLGAGAVISALHHEQDIRKMGGLWKDLPLITALFAVGSLALAGVPPFAGFFSKDAILGDVLYQAEHSGSPAWWFVLVALLIAAAMTALYTTRLFMLAFVVPAAPADPGHHDHGHDAHRAHGGGRHLIPVHWSMTIVLIGLACLAVGGGFLGPHIKHFTEPVWSTGHVDPEALHHAHSTAMIVSTALALTGIAAGVVVYGTQRAAMARFVAGAGAPLFRLASEKFYVDELYDFLIVRPIGWASQNAWEFIDRRFIDEFLVEGAGNSVMSTGALLRTSQSGVVGVATASTLVGAVLVLLWLVSNG